jgi:hypothetical protein
LRELLAQAEAALHAFDRARNMTDTAALDSTGLSRWRDNPISFIEEILYDPETGRPFVLLDAERAFMRHAFRLDDNGRLLYPEQVYSCPKKSGKTTFAALPERVNDFETPFVMRLASKRV